MSDYLPADIWREILLKLPVESLIRFTTVCKSWKSLIVSPDFIYAHLSLSKNHSILRGYDEHDKHHHYLPSQFTQIGISGFFQIRPEIPFKSKFGVYRIVGSCDGIVCFTDWYWRVILWNPSVRNHVVLPEPQAITNRKGPHHVFLGFGMANHVYKVVCLSYGSKRYRAEIFSIGTKGWRSVCGFDIKLRCFTSNPLRCMWSQVLLEGIIHWLGYELFDDTRSRSSILSFDLGAEVFGEVMLPDVLVMERFLRLHKIGGSLAVVKSGAYFFDVWVMKENGVKAHWTKLYNIDLHKVTKLYNIDLHKVNKNVNGFFGLVGFNNGEALLKYIVPRQKYSDLVSYNLETKQFKDLEILGTRSSFYIDDYVESLLLLKGNNVPAVEEIAEPVESLNMKD